MMTRTFALGATLMLCALASGAHAAPPCEGCTTEAITTRPADFWLDAAWSGVALTDLPPDSGLDGPSLDAALRALDPASLTETFSVSVVGQRGRRLSVMFVGRSPRFSDAHPKHPRAGGLGVVVLSFVPPTGRSEPLAVDSFRLLEEHALADLAPRLRVSLVDRTVVLDLPGLGLRRTFPAGVGALDNIRAAPELTSLTPLSERARVGRQDSYEALNTPSWARGMPYLTLQIPWVATTPGPLSQERLWFAKTRLAFHVWPGQTFTRGYNSRGCITLRDPDLLELSAFVFGAKDALPLTIRDLPFDDAVHPFPHERDHYWRLVDVGRPGAPAFTTYGGLYHIEKVKEPVPEVADLVGRYFESEQRAQISHRLASHDVPLSLIP